MFLGLVAFTEAQAQPAVRPDVGSYFRRTIERDQGLPETRVTSLAETPDGYKWLGTRRGLVRYDGLTFTVFSPDNTPAIIDHWINAVSTDRRGRLWAGTAAGLVVLDRGGFRRIPWDQVPRAGTFGVLEDQTGRLWVATAGGVLTGDGTRFRPVPGGVHFTDALALDRAGHVWLAGRGLFGRIEGDSVVNYAGLFKGVGRFYDVVADAAGQVWVGTREGATAVTLDRTGRPVRGRTVSTRTAGMEHPVWTLGLTPDGLLWLGTSDAGTFAWDGESLRPAGGTEQIWGFLTDTRGRLWAGTGAGLERYQRSPFTTIPARAQEPSVWAVRPGGGTVWASLGDGGVARWNGAGFDQVIRGSSNTLSSPIWPMPGGLLVSEASRRLVALDSAGRKRPLPLIGLPPGDILGMLRDDRGVIWLSADSGVYRIDGNRVRPAHEELGLLPGERPREMVVDRLGRLLVGRPGLTVIESGRATRYREPEGLIDGAVRALLPSGRDVWIGTADSGLYVLRQDRIVYLGGIDPRLGREVLAIAEDDDGFLWLTSSYGLSRVARSELEAAADGRASTVAVRSFDRVDGLPTTDFNTDFQSTIYKDALGRLWLPSPRGIVRVDPAQVPVDTTPPNVILERTVVDGTVHPAGESLALSSGVGRIEFTFATTGALVPERVRVQFRLLGVDTAWTDAGLRRTTGFGPLRGGQYRFEVRAATEAGPWGRSPAVVAFAVAKSIPEQPWFLPGLAALSGGLVLLAAWIRQRGLERRGRVLTRMVEAKTRDLETARVTLERRVEERTAQLAGELAERTRLEQQLVTAQKLEGLGRLAGGMAHEINNSMTAVLGFTQLAATAARGQRQILEDLGEASRAGERVASITRQLLAFARQHRGVAAPIDLGQVVRTLVPSLTQTVGPMVRIEVEVPDEPTAIAADRAQIEQVILNLVINARDAMPGGGTVRLALTGRHAQSRLTVGDTSLKTGDYWVLSVTDPGVGMSAEVRARLFEPFFTTKAVGQGTGLGLAVCHGVVAQHGGAIGCVSELGLGTTFEVWLPAAGRNPGPEPGPPGPVTGDETILVVDDDAVVREVVTQLLHASGYQVLTAEDGVEALTVAEARSGEVALVLTDVMMPRLNGVELARRLRAEQPDLPVVFMSGFVGDEVGIDVELAGLGTMIPKPFTSEVVALTIRRALDVRRAGPVPPGA